MSRPLLLLLLNFVLSMGVFIIIRLLFKNPKYTKPTEAFQRKTRNQKKYRIKSNFLKSCVKFIERLLSLSQAKISVMFFLIETVVLFVVAFISSYLFLKLPLFSMLMGVLAASIPLIYYTNKKNKKSKSITDNVKRFIQACQEAASIYSTQREILTSAAKGCQEPLKSLVSEYMSFRDIPVHEAMYDLSKELDDRTLRAFAIILRKQYKTGNEISDTIGNFNMTISTKNDVEFIKRVALLYANSQFKWMVVFFCLNFVLFKLLIPTALDFFYTPLGTWVLLFAVVMVFVNLVLILVENIV